MSVSRVARMFFPVGVALALAVGAAAVPIATIAGAVTTGHTYTPMDFGAVGDGHTDDGPALQRALDALAAGDTLSIPAGPGFAHGQVLTVHVAGAHIAGPGTLIATNESQSAFDVAADNVVVDGALHVTVPVTTKRWSTPNQMAIVLAGHSGVTLRGVSVNGSAAAGIFVHGASFFTIDNVTVANTRADGIHMTDGSHDGTVSSSTVSNSGDDGFAVVSYSADPATCYNITVKDTRFLGNTWGRGYTVSGGHDITLSNIYSQNSNVAGLYIASEPMYNTASVNNIKVQGGRLVGSNYGTVDHGAVLVWSGHSGHSVTNVDLSGLSISKTRPTAYRIVGIVSNDGGQIGHITMADFTISGPNRVFASNVPPSQFNLRGWTVNGVAMPDRIGW